MSDIQCSSIIADNLTPRLFSLKLNEIPPMEENVTHQMWILDDENGIAQPLGATEESWPRPVQAGDLVLFPELSSGAGEFEGLRYVGERLADGSGLPLLLTSVESPVFPGMFEQPNLRAKYEPLLEGLVQSQGLSLTDLFGGAAVVEEFWESPDMERRRLTEIKLEWKIPLNECTCLKLCGS